MRAASRAAVHESVGRCVHRPQYVAEGRNASPSGRSAEIHGYQYGQNPDKKQNETISHSLEHSLIPTVTQIVDSLLTSEMLGTQSGRLRVMKSQSIFGPKSKFVVGTQCAEGHPTCCQEIYDTRSKQEDQPSGLNRG